MNIITRYQKTFFLCVFALLLQSQARAQDGQSKNIQVICPNKTDTRILSFDAAKNLWCDSVVSDVCRPIPLDVAKQVCKRPYAISLRKLGADSSSAALSSYEEIDLSESKSVEPDQERLKLESELLSIQEKQLDIKRKLIGLEEEISEIKDQAPDR